MAEIQLKGIVKRFGDIQTIHGVDLQIDDGDFVVFVGPSGCGKSTLLRLIAGLEDISGGDMYIGGKRVNDLPPPKRGIAMVFQSYALYPHMTIYENMAFGLKLAKQGKEEIDQRVRNAARILQMEHLLDRLPKELSGGQRQRVAIGRAIVRNPQVFLFDEPLSNLDAALRVQTRIEIYKLHSDLKTTMIYVTHDQVEAMTLADKIVVLNAGTVAQVGAPLELYHHPDNLFVAGFIGSPKMNFIDGTVDQVSDGQVTVNLKSGTKLTTRVKADGAKPGDTVKVGVRPEHLLVDGSGGGNVQGEVMLVEHLGEGSLVYVRTPDLENDTLVVRLNGDTPIRAGEKLTVTIPDKDTHLFNADGRSFRRIMTSGEETRTPAMSQA